MAKYSEKLKDPRWQKLRLKVFERDEWTCRSCGREDRTLAVHHLYYARDKQPWEYNPEFLVTLCEECHEVETQFRREAEEQLLEALRLRGSLVCHLEDMYYALAQTDASDSIVPAVYAFVKVLRRKRRRGKQQAGRPQRST